MNWKHWHAPSCDGFPDTIAKSNRRTSIETPRGSNHKLKNVSLLIGRQHPKISDSRQLSLGGNPKPNVQPAKFELRELNFRRNPTEEETRP
ncbi:hypothetical protein AAFG07_07520 [Bradyrhizobium sp. B097]|uniref:hypothetical protein n=1 Tax=Bradyrhizobium sp. B097 TaxID=3140244 RepID=UPI0031831025